MVAFPKKTSALLVLFAVVLGGQTAVSGISQNDIDSLLYGAPYYDSTSAGSCSTVSSVSTSSNQDYAGRAILNQGELQAVANNQSFYQQAAGQAGIPWQLLASLHYREHGLSRQEPNSNPGDGVYQILSGSYPDGSPYKTPGAYPGAGAQLTDQQFSQQTLDAAKFIKNKLPALSASSSPPDIKNAMGLYNGLPALYATQAQALGFGADQAYEGSPYVMNFADAKRDPTVVAAGTWQQYGTGPNGSIGPANTQKGGFLVYASVSGVSIGGSCFSSSCDNGTNSTVGLSPARQTVVCLAQAELAKWNSGQLKPGVGYLTYTQNAQEDWCADFVSWVYDQAKYPLQPDPNWRVAAVSEVKSIGQNDQNFHYHAKSGYTPKPGDIAIHTDGTDDYHVNIVVGVDGNTITLVGGNQSSNDFNQSNVSKVVGADDVSGYVSPD